MTHPYETPYVPPPYPYDLLDELRAAAVERFGASIDCSIGAGCRRWLAAGRIVRVGRRPIESGIDPCSGSRMPSVSQNGFGGLVMSTVGMERFPSAA